AFAFSQSAVGSVWTAFRSAPLNSAVSTPIQGSFGRFGVGNATADTHFAVVVSDPKRKVDIYVNGALIDTFPYSTPLNELQTADVQVAGILKYLQTNSFLNQPGITEGYIGHGV